MNGNIPPTSIRIPDEIKFWLGHRAVDNKSSMTKEILDILRKEKDREGKQLNAKKVSTPTVAPVEAESVIHTSK
ncbi:hypothetical protein [Aeromonas caviae]|uniref:hypothetical protein n=1 Tax=Aeromonas caviae TaxID=648 RepID=UPI002449ED31|nr:hypothetical protein [Aeromonas caviae]MDH1634719.1 hypothetical protein [Aeromonas caviae]